MDVRSAAPARPHGSGQARSTHALSASTRRQRRFWAYAAAFGALWGGLEITVGSFLHNLRIPFGGFVLTAVGAALLVAQRQLHAAAGLSAATGIIAAACKSISPGGVILGPMLAIVCEALVVELALLAAPRARLSAAAAGMLALQWTTAQAVLSQYVYYGGHIIDLYLGVLRRIATGIGVAGGAPGLVAVVLAVPALGGALAGLLGRRLGRLARRRVHAAAGGDSS